MKIFVTGASGFIGSAVVRELLSAGHNVIGLARSASAAMAVRDAGAEVLSGDLAHPEILMQGASEADAVIHTAFVHDFMYSGKSTFLEAATIDKTAIQAMGNVLLGTNKPMVVTSGILGLPLIDGTITEESRFPADFPRSSETTALSLAEKGVNASVIRLAPSVHDRGDRGFIPFIISQARKHGVSAYPGDGNNRWTAVHRSDAAKAYRLAVEKGRKAALYNVVGDTGIPIKTIAALIGSTLNLPVVSVPDDAITNHFDWMSRFIAFDSPATNFNTQAQLGWKPEHSGLLDDMQQNYF